MSESEFYVGARVRFSTLGRWRDGIVVDVWGDLVCISPDKVPGESLAVQWRNPAVHEVVLASELCPTCGKSYSFTPNEKAAARPRVGQHVASVCSSCRRIDFKSGDASIRRWLPSRSGFLWKAHFWTDHSHPTGYRSHGYSKFFRAWTRRGAARMAKRHRHQKWAFDVKRSAG